jgi:acyl transferase domain-containing protein/thioesterase domain-containing protein
MYRADHDFKHAAPPDDEDNQDSVVAIIGMSCRFAGARGIDAYWQALCDAKECIERYTDEALIAAGVDGNILSQPDYVPAGAPLEDMECFDHALFGLSPRDAAIMDPQHRHFLECAWEALEDAGHVPERVRGAIGVFGGTGHNAYLSANLMTNPKLLRDVGLFLLRHTGNDKDFLSTRVSYLLNLKGPSVNVQTACSTSLVAIHTAAQSLLNGECDMALAGAASIELPHRQGYFHEEGGIASADGHCRPFDADSTGAVFGSGVGVLLLRRLTDAIADNDHIYAVIRGSAVNNDGSGKVSYLSPSVDGHANVVSEALDIAQVTARSIDYVEAHGTGTRVGDPIEIAALTQAYRRHTPDRGFCGIGSVKGNIGHTDTAAGAASVIKVALALHHGAVPPTLHYHRPNPACEFPTSPFAVTAALQPWLRTAERARRAGVSSLGVGGTNAHIIMEEAPPRSAGSASRPCQLLLVSAQSATALDANCAALAEHLSTHPGDDLADVAYSLHSGRQSLRHRRIVVARSKAEAAERLSSPASARLHGAMAAGADRPVAFLFCGAGAQYAGMGAELYATEPLFRAVIDQCLAHLGREEGEALKRWLYPEKADAAGADEAFTRPSIALPLLFAVQVALARLWMSWGVTPSAMIGHSSGEYAAAHLAGIFSLADALTIVQARGRLFETLPAGSMLSVPLSEAELLPLISQDLSIAAVNGPKLVVISGPTPQISALAQELAARDVETQCVGISVAAHSMMLDPILDDFRRLMMSITLNPPMRAFISNLTGDWITPIEASDPEYWVRHLRHTVRFTDGLSRLLADSDRVLLEVGPGRIMSSLARQHPNRSPDQPIFNSMRHKDDAKTSDLPHLLETVGGLWVSGVALDWDAFWKQERRCRIPLPTYRFDRHRHWYTPGISAVPSGPMASADLPSDQPPPRRPDMADWLYEQIWQRSRRKTVAPTGVDALVFADRAGIGMAVAQALRDQGCSVAIVRPGRRFKSLDNDNFEINASAAEDYSRLVAALVERDHMPRHIYHCWLVTGQDNHDLASLQDHGLFSLIFLAQALGERDHGPVAIAVVSDRMQRVSDEDDLMPAKATILGPSRVIPREYPDISLRNVDIRLPPKGSPGWRWLCDTLIAELDDIDGEEVVAYRASERWVAHYASADMTAHPISQIPAKATFKEGGIYFITGGLGGLGLLLAGHLARTCQARLVLLTRHPLPSRSQWPDIMARGGADPHAQKIRQLAAIEADGGEVMLITADICDEHALKRAIRLGAIDGVFHAAGILDDGLIQLKTRASIERVLSAKLLGTMALHHALKGEQPDFLLLFSSISAFAGMPGQVDYGAANAFLDAYAQSRRNDLTRVTSIAWSRWQDVGMASDLSDQVARDRAMATLDPGEAMQHPFLASIHRLSPTQIVAQASLSPDRDWLLDEHRLAEGGALMPGTGFLELVQAAFAQIEPGPAELRDILFLRPFAVADGEYRHLRIHLHQRGDGDWRFSILGSSGSDATASLWSEHVRGAIRHQDDRPSAPIDLDALVIRCATIGDIAPLADETSMMRFGPRWQSVRQLRIGTNEALLELALDARFEEDLSHISLHPALLDFATAGAQCLIAERIAGQDFFAPASYGSVKLYGPLPAHVFSHICYRPSVGDAVAQFDIVLTDSDGFVLAEVIDFTMLKMSGGAQLSSPDPAPIRTPNRLNQTEQAEDGILPGEGLRIIEMLLAGHRASHVIISPPDLHQAVARIRMPYRPDRIEDRGEDEAGDPPATAAERIIADIWSDMLGIRHIRRSDDFFDLGGHSLLGVQFMNRLRKRTGRQLPLATLLETATVKALGALIDPGGATELTATSDDRAPDINRKIITIRPGTPDKTPLFLIHDGLGETLLYRALAMRMDPDRAVLGIEPERYVSGSYTHTGIAQMATAYVARIRAAQPHGPYLLAGLCAGGVIAFEMARQLQDLGERTAFVGIIDAADVEAHRRSFYITRTRIHRLRALLRDGSAGRNTPLALVARRAANAVAYDLTTRLEWIRRTRKVARMAQGNGAQDHDRAAPPDLSFLHLYEVAHRAHRPKGLFEGGDVVLFKATQGSGADDDVPYVELYTDYIFGWGKRVAGDVSLVPIPGGHSSALQEPNVDSLATAMRDAISRAISGPYTVPVPAWPVVPSDIPLQAGVMAYIEEAVSR